MRVVTKTVCVCFCRLNVVGCHVMDPERQTCFQASTPSFGVMSSRAGSIWCINYNIGNPIEIKSPISWHGAVKNTAGLRLRLHDTILVPGSFIQSFTEWREFLTSYRISNKN